ncbi:MAG TPA: purine-nucleoside phosphorylase [bacterium]|nr:purine-nucleoside phosphorylase [bacterium]
MAPVLYDRVEGARAFLAGLGMGSIDAALVLDAELDPVVAFTEPTSVRFSDVPGFPRSERASSMRVECGNVGRARILVLRGRVFGYEGVTLAEATLPIRAARVLGATGIVLAGAAVALHEAWGAGDIVFSTDQLNWMGDNPLIGPHDERLGVRFPDMSRAYDPALVESAEKAAQAGDPIPTRRGIYAGVAGPQRPTAAEKSLLRACGADLAGMSAVPETIVAVHSGLSVFGISIIDEPTDSWPHIARRAAPGIDRIVRGVLQGMKK